METTEQLAQQQENKLGTMPIGPLLLSVSVPIVVSMLVQALYNVVDSIFVAQLSENALAAVSLAFPVQNLMIAVSVGTSVGVNSLLSRRLGEKNFEAANRAASNGVFLSVVSWVAFLAFGIFFSDLVYAGYANNPEVGPEIAKMAADYTRIVTTASLFLFVSIMYGRLLQATGRSMLSMTSQMVGAVVNIVLDPIMIFGLLGFPKMGVVGAALATIIGQAVSMVTAIVLNTTRNKDIKVELRGFRPHGMTIKHIYQVGLPTIVMQSIGSVMTTCMNVILAGYSSTAVSFFGAYFKLQSFAVMPIIGFNNGLVPIAAYNYGARRPQRIAKAIKFTILCCFCYALVCMVLIELIPGQLLMMFNAQEYMLAIGIPAMRIIAPHFLLASVVIIFIGFFQAAGEGMASLIISGVRQLVFLLPAAFLLSMLFGLDAIWWCFLIAEAAALVLSAFMLRRVWQRKIAPMQREQALEEGQPGVDPAIT